MTSLNDTIVPTPAKTDKHDGCVRGFHHHKGAYYASTFPADEPDCVTVGMYGPKGGTTGEFSIEWVMLDGEAVPRLKAFNDSWSFLASFQDFLISHDDVNVTPLQMCDLLRGLGFVDLTRRVAPAHLTRKPS